MWVYDTPKITLDFAELSFFMGETVLESLIRSLL